MAQTKAKRPSRSKAPSDAERIEREYRPLALAIGDVEGFRLYLATYNDPRRRDELIDRLTTESKHQNLRVTRLDVSSSDREASLVRLLREHLSEDAERSARRRAVMVVGIEGLLDYADTREGLAVLETANLQRDVFPNAVPVPVVFWLSPLASSAFPKAAPDLWHWRYLTSPGRFRARGLTSRQRCWRTSLPNLIGRDRQSHAAKQWSGPICCSS